MNKSQITRIITGMGYQTNSLIQTPEINALILSNNQGINHRESFLMFDTNNDLIKIKHFKYEVVSGRLSNSVNIAGSELSVSNSIYLRHSIHPFRAPKVGDIILIINADGSYKNTGIKIVATATNYIKLSGTLTGFNKSTQQLCYADGANFANSIQDSDVPALFFKYTPISENNIDVYLDLGDMIGIEMHYPMLGSV